MGVDQLLSQGRVSTFDGMTRAISRMMKVMMMMQKLDIAALQPRLTERRYERHTL